MLRLFSSAWKTDPQYIEIHCTLEETYWSGVKYDANSLKFVSAAELHCEICAQRMKVRSTCLNRGYSPANRPGHGPTDFSLF